MKRWVAAASGTGGSLHIAGCMQGKLVLGFAQQKDCGVVCVMMFAAMGVDCLELEDCRVSYFILVAYLLLGCPGN